MAVKELDISREEIAEKVRKLRLDRRWTQAELARRLRLSQSRLSEIERGAGSFTAEQFLTILKLFNVGLSHFAGQRPSGHEHGLQNALARLGAVHLQEQEDVLPSERLEDVNDVVRETLIAGAPRQITALGPVLIGNIDRVNLKRIYARLAEAGLERRLPWLVENILELIEEHENWFALPQKWAKKYRRAAVVLEAFLSSLTPTEHPPDVLDPDIRSKATLQATRANLRHISRKWGMVTRLIPEDFSFALRAAHVGV